jgi:predicted SAM-dependent methyltransferase
LGQIKVNVGCGVSGIAGWVNIDNSPTIVVSRIPLLRHWMKVPHGLVRKGLPFSDGAVDYIYSSHTFEHFTYEASLALSRECFRVLRLGGILRVVVPDLGLIVKQYLADSQPLASHRMVDRLSLNHTLHDWLHPGSNHSQMFDRHSLVHLLESAGFSAPRVSRYRESEILEIDQIELEARRAESLYTEAKKT